jgi:hypothetical protein
MVNEKRAWAAAGAVGSAVGAVVFFFFSAHWSVVCLAGLVVSWSCLAGWYRVAAEGAEVRLSAANAAYLAGRTPEAPEALKGATDPGSPYRTPAPHDESDEIAAELRKLPYPLTAEDVDFVEATLLWWRTPGGIKPTCHAESLVWSRVVAVLQQTRIEQLKAELLDVLTKEMS